MSRTKSPPREPASDRKEPERPRLVPNEIGRECLGVRVRALSRTITRIYDRSLRPHGLTASQLNLLALIPSGEPARSGDVADLLSMEISTLSRNAHLMERQGWITVKRAERGNGRTLQLTTAGERKLAEAIPAWREAQKEARSFLGADGARTVKGLVDGRVFQAGPE
jgi:DNA-binding MarR family transcriptional regulator